MKLISCHVRNAKFDNLVWVTNHDLTHASRISRIGDKVVLGQGCVPGPRRVTGFFLVVALGAATVSPGVDTESDTGTQYEKYKSLVAVKYDEICIVSQFYSILAAFPIPGSEILEKRFYFFKGTMNM